MRGEAKEMRFSEDKKVGVFNEYFEKKKNLGSKKSDMVMSMIQFIEKKKMDLCFRLLVC